MSKLTELWRAEEQIYRQRPTFLTHKKDPMASELVFAKQAQLLTPPHPQPNIPTSPSSVIFFLPPPSTTSAPVSIVTLSPLRLTVIKCIG